MVLITELDLETTKEYLRIDHSDDDQMISIMIESAKSYIQSYLDIKFSDFGELPLEFTISALALISHWYENREIQADKNTANELSYVFKGLLDLHRKWN